ncbi:MAG: hypothetical protein RBS11_00215 [Sulfurimonas sp.]|nr:hypothetical protein [Sulfurimonas sp.]
MIILKFLLLFAGTLLVASIIGFAILKSVTIAQHKKYLQNSISLIELKKVENLQEYTKKVSQATGLRVTIISEDGSVLAESLSDVSHMDNHSSRNEISQASKGSFAHAKRESKTLNTDFLYVAKKVSYRDDSIYIRLSVSIEAIMSEFNSLFFLLFLSFLFIFALAFYISKKMSEKISYDIEQITNYLDEITKKNYGAVIKIEYFYEFLQIALIVKNLVKKLHSKDKLKRKK